MNNLRFFLNLLLQLFTAKGRTNKKPTPPVQPKKQPVTPTATVKPAPAPPAEKKPPAPVIELSPDSMKTTLMLGHHDEGVDQNQIKTLLGLYHRNMPDVPQSTREGKMRQGDLFAWVNLKPVAGTPVKALQTFLVNAGIMHPTSNCDGVFAYATQAGVRLFQEYVRIYEGRKIIPNGIVDEATWTIMKEWQDQKKTAVNWTRGKQSEEYQKWMGMMKKAQAEYKAQPNKILAKVNERIDQLNAGAGKKVDTIRVDDWTFNDNDIHLIGIRRKEDASGAARLNDDVFVLLINGMVFKFWGSTDPKQHAEKRQDEAFLSEGQHKFRFGWHNVSAGRNEKLYQGLNPFDRGVLVFRDDLRNNDNRLTDADIDKGIDKAPNQSINIHWTGEGHGASGTWSEGCQVMAGGSYIDPQGKTISCGAFAGGGTADLQSNRENRITKTKGAYNLFTDLVLVYPPERVDYLIYTLGRDETLSHDFLEGLGGQELLAGALTSFGMRPDEGLA